MDGGVHDVDSVAIGRDNRKADALFSPTNKAMRMKTTTKRSGVGRRVDRRSSDDDDGRLMMWENYYFVVGISGTRRPWGEERVST